MKSFCSNYKLQLIFYFTNILKLNFANIIYNICFLFVS